MYRYKDVNPSETLQNIKDFLCEIGITVSENWFDSKIENIYSLRIEIENTPYGTNGKGIKKELALASAYGELIERIGNGIIFKSGERNNTKDVGFTYFPDEKSI